MPITEDGYLTPTGEDAEPYHFFGELVTDGFKEFFAHPQGGHGLSVANYMLAVGGCFAAHLLILQQLQQANIKQVNGAAFESRDVKEMLARGWLQMANEIGKTVGLSKADMARLRRETHECAKTEVVAR